MGKDLLLNVTEQGTAEAEEGALPPMLSPHYGAMGCSFPNITPLFPATEESESYFREPFILLIKQINITSPYLIASIIFCELLQFCCKDILKKH